VPMAMFVNDTGPPAPKVVVYGALVTGLLMT